ncbi:hypothetical protein HCX60_06170 [Streptomyces antibioticus]|uniref:Uncharacterized protein n=1 Tax=Streptomyces antibioticus TaxID=1890 RepID=A0AAE7CK10_STRAT|nr:hypothetical protein HCX60_06170 [Streptomyces antibioticus]
MASQGWNSPSASWWTRESKTLRWMAPVMSCGLAWMSNDTGSVSTA